MGREIVYCEGCGKRLHEDDFTRRRAQTVENRHYCSDCRPVPAEPARPDSSSRTLKPPERKGSTAHLPSAPPSTRRQRAAAPKSPVGLIIGLVVGGAALAVILVAAATSGSGPPAAIQPPPSAPPKTAAEPLDDIVRQVEAFAKTSLDPDAVLTRCDEARQKLRGRPGLIDRLRPIEQKAAADRRARQEAAQLDGFLSNIRTRRNADKDFRHAQEIRDSYRKAAEIAGARAAEVRKEAQDYEAAFERRSVGDWSTWKIESHDDGGANRLLETHGGRSNVFMTHPFTREKPASLERDFDLPAGRRIRLSLAAAPHEKGDWELRALADGKLLHKQTIGPAKSGWRPVAVDLSALAGRKVRLRLENAATGWEWEHGYWAAVELVVE